MANFTRMSKFSSLLLIGFLLLVIGTANAAYINGVNGCYDTVAHSYVDASFCSASGTDGTTGTTASRATTAQTMITQIILNNNGTNGANNNNTSADMISIDCKDYGKSSLKICKRTNSKQKVLQECESDSSTRSCKTYDDNGNEEKDKSCKASTLEQRCTFGVVPSKGRFFVQNLSADAGYAYTIINGSNSLLGSAHEMSTAGFAISSLWDFGDWGVSVVAPFRHTMNNSRYSALDNSQFGVVIAPTYHLLKEQIHVMSFDFGTRVGYNRTWFSDAGAVRNPSGNFGFSDFSDFNTLFAGLNAQFGKQISSSTRLNAGVDFSVYHNDNARSLVGDSGNMLFMSAGLSHSLSDQFIISGSIQGTNFRQNTFDSTSLYSSLGAGAILRINNRSTLSFNLNQSIAAPGFSTTAANLSFLMEWQ